MIETEPQFTFSDGHTWSRSYLVLFQAQSNYDIVMHLSHGSVLYFAILCNMT